MRSITKKELLLAISASELQQTSHVHFIPPGVNYTDMLVQFRSLNYVEPIGEHFYKLTNKGRRQIADIISIEVLDIDKAIDEFVDNL